METTAKEASVQASLAKNLHLLEGGLTLAKVNYQLTHSDGTKGFIDILAKDKYGNRVVIELKRSDQAGRQAIHEIFKYLSSFRQQNQFPKHKIRCFIVSTIWREMLVPFSEFVRASDVQVRGFKLTVTVKGRVREAKEVKPVDSSKTFIVRRSQDVFYCRTKQKRNKAQKILSELFVEFGGDSGLIIPLDYKGDNRNVINPFAIYLATGAINTTRLREAIKKYQTPKRRLCDYVDSVPDKLSSSLQVLLSDHRDDFSIGFPERLLAMTQSGWEPQPIIRIGAVPDDDAASDDELLNIATGIEGENLVMFERMATPHVRENWTRIKKAALVALQCNTHWRNAVTWFLRKVEKEYPNDSVTIRIYNPQNLVESLYWFLVRCTFDMIPKFEVAVYVEGKCVEAIAGTLMWNSDKRPTTVKEAFGGRYGGFGTVPFRAVTHETRADDEMLIARHGLYYAAFHGMPVDDDATRKEIHVEKVGRKLVSQKVEKKGVDLFNFEASNRNYLMELMEKYTRNMARV